MPVDKIIHFGADKRTNPCSVLFWFSMSVRTQRSFSCVKLGGKIYIHSLHLSLAEPRMWKDKIDSRSLYFSGEERTEAIQLGPDVFMQSSRVGWHSDQGHKQLWDFLSGSKCQASCWQNTPSIVYHGKISSKVEEVSLVSRESISLYLMTL